MASQTDENLGKLLHKKRKISSFISARWGKGHLSEMLMARGIERINEYLLEMMLQYESRIPSKSVFDPEELYLVYRPNVEPEEFLCLLGSELKDRERESSKRSLKFEMPSRRKLIVSRKWHLRQNTFESTFAKTFDIWQRHHLDVALLQLQMYATVISSEIRPWSEVLRIEGKPLKDRLMVFHLGLIEGLEQEERVLKEKSAPGFMIRDCEKNKTRMKKILRKISEETASS